MKFQKSSSPPVNLHTQSVALIAGVFIYSFMSTFYQKTTNVIFWVGEKVWSGKRLQYWESSLKYHTPFGWTLRAGSKLSPQCASATSSCSMSPRQAVDDCVPRFFIGNFGSPHDHYLKNTKHIYISGEKKGRRWNTFESRVGKCS